MAWTERYVSVAGSGAHDGTSAANSWTLAEAITGVAAGHRPNVLAGTYANTTTSRTFSTAGTATANIWWRGYKTTIGDQDTNNLGVAGTDIPSITFTTGAMTISGGNQKFSNLDISGATTAGGTGLVVVTGVSVDIYRCRFQNTAVNSGARAVTYGGSSTGTIVACYAKATTTADRCLSLGTNVMLYGSTITGGIIGANQAAQGQSIGYCIFDSQAGDAISIASSVNANIFNCGFYAPLGNGINFPGATVAKSLITNCYFSTVNQASKAAINNTSGANVGTIICVGNAYFNCTANTSGITESFAIFDNGTLASEAFTDPSNQNFAILPIGQGIGFPGLFENVSLYQGFPDISAVQHQAGVGAQRPFPGSGGII
jgi:hypothetical protein